MVVQGVPDAHVDEGDARDLVCAPERVERLQGAGFAGRPGQPQQLEVAALEYEREGFRERRVRHTLKERLVDVVEGNRLLDVVAHLVDGDVVALVVHAVLLDARPQVRLVALEAGARGVAGAARGMDVDARGDEVGPVLRKAELHEEVRNVLRVRRGRGVLRAHEGVELGGGSRRLRTEPRIPDVDGHELASETLFDERRDLRDERRREDVFQHLLHARLWNLTVLLELSRDERGGCWREGVRLPDRAEAREERRVPRIGLGAGGRRARFLRGKVRVLDRRRTDLVRERVPIDPGVVEDGARDRLVDDALHDPPDRPLLRGTRRAAFVVGLDLVAEIPVRKEAHLRRKEADALLVHEVVHPDVVRGDVLGRVRLGLRDREIDARGNARREPVGEARFGPLTPRPGRTDPQLLLERVHGEVQERRERELVVEEVVREMRARLVARENLVEREDRPAVEVHVHAQLAARLAHVPVEGDERARQPREKLVTVRGTGRRVRTRERLEGRRVAVGRAPQRRHLLSPAGGARSLAANRRHRDSQDNEEKPSRVHRRNLSGFSFQESF